MRGFMTTGVLSLVLGYVLSQFYRGFLTVLSGPLADQIGAQPGDLALASGTWFLVFAAMQLPIGWALDTYGPRRTVAGLLGVFGSAGAAVFAMAQEPWHLVAAMALIGVGCAPIMVGAYYIFAHNYPRSQFGMLAGTIVGLGSAGDLLGASPLVWISHAIGWRATLWMMAGLTMAVALTILTAVRDPAPTHSTKARPDAPRASLGQVLRLRALWPLLPLCLIVYAAPAAIRGLWAGPYLTEVFRADTLTVGHSALAMGVAMIVANLFVGPTVGLIGSVRRATLITGGAGAVALAGLAAFPGSSVATGTALLALLALSGGSFALTMAHGRAFLPPHLVGRGMTFLNMISMGGVGLMQFISRPYYAWAAEGRSPEQTFALVFLLFLVPLVIGIGVYTLTAEAPND
ncbi:MAG: MFS transporter [Paracoccus denitrificans]|nr:MAG: MFS transporter [Paracoccus denitrificans]PZO86394.1 MAG: MFS transporter [Paracoccus denitrificans]